MYKAFPYEKTSVRTKLYKCFYVFISYRERISFISDAAPRRLTSKCACGRVLFKSQLLTLGYDFVLDIDLWVPTSFLATEVKSEQAFYRLLRLIFYQSEQAHTAVHPFQIEPACAGLRFGFSFLRANVLSLHFG